MSMVPMMKKCSKCHKKYSFNPDVGHFSCPYCHGLGTPLSNLTETIEGQKKKSAEDSKKE